MSEQRYIIRRRGEGWAVWDSEMRMTLGIYPTVATAEKAAAVAAIPTRTYGITWYAEVDAASEVEAVAIATKRFIAAPWREGWEPVAVEEVH